MTKEDIKKKLLKAGVKNLKEFGYPNVNEENILTDIVYGGFFKSMLEENKGYTPKVDEVIEELLKQVNKDAV
jgi:hypothetical protein